MARKTWSSTRIRYSTVLGHRVYRPPSSKRSMHGYLRLVGAPMHGVRRTPLRGHCLSEPLQRVYKSAFKNIYWERNGTDLTTARYNISSFPRPSRGGGLAVIFHDRFSFRISFTTSCPFDHSTLELTGVCMSTTQQTVNFFRVYRPPSSRKNKQEDSTFIDHLHSLFEYCNSLHDSFLNLGDFNIHYSNPGVKPNSNGKSKS